MKLAQDSSAFPYQAHNVSGPNCMPQIRMICLCKLHWDLNTLPFSTLKYVLADLNRESADRSFYIALHLTTNLFIGSNVQWELFSRGLDGGIGTFF